MDAGLDGGVLGRKPEAVEPNGAQHRLALHRPLTNKQVTERVVADVTLVGRSTRVGVHAEHVGGGARVVVVDLVGALFGPASLPFGLDRLGVVLLCHALKGTGRPTLALEWLGAVQRLRSRGRVEAPTCSSSQPHSGRAARRRLGDPAFRRRRSQPGRRRPVLHGHQALVAEQAGPRVVFGVAPAAPSSGGRCHGRRSWPYGGRLISASRAGPVPSSATARRYRSSWSRPGGTCRPRP